MTHDREDSPPAIPGYTYLRDLGAGGYSRVYLYAQHMPQREVAVKVMSCGVSLGPVSRFESEANLMAQVSSHPAILSIYGAGTADDGRPFLVMEYCPPPQLSAVLHRGPLSVADALSTTIQIAGAVESAHRVGIVHRDIKPSNILFTAYRRPVLSDFGISAMSGPRSENDELRGMSVPWAPPEQLVGSRLADPASDIYSLAATAYAMLTGRSPFEIPEASDSVYELSRRIIKDPLPPLGRQDVPPSLYRVLSVAMDKDPTRRYPSALALARALQQVQAELGLPITAVDLFHAAGESDPAPDDDVLVDDPKATRLGVFEPITEAETQVPVVDVQGMDSEPETGRRRSRLLIGMLATVVTAAVVIAAVVSSRMAEDGRPVATFATLAPAASADPLGASVAAPRNLVGNLSDDGTTVTFTWEAPEDDWDGSFLYREDLAGNSDPAMQSTQATTVDLPARQDSTCIEVYAVRADGRTSAPTSLCVRTVAGAVHSVD
ncbi:serine/threonine-protein kinase [Actinomyces ruminis]|uniref:non-specific serine/threonine protein kinase n=1 Tax=Actinomyces ruminis TaxID=1937003 RepID=A0ABX4MER1_9ACTO|nr:serine/threonine-protein kinase [Actinomyces ruminis]PHP53658.1 serine/threonine protein kinase [Actinomyces ruminis]